MAAGELFVKVTPVKAGTAEDVAAFQMVECPPDVEADTLLSFLTQQFGEPIDAAIVSNEKYQRLQVGWIFPGPPTDVPEGTTERICTPFIELDDGSRVAMFAWLADTREVMERNAKDGSISELNVISKDQREYQPFAAPVDDPLELVTALLVGILGPEDDAKSVWVRSCGEVEQHLSAVLTALTGSQERAILIINPAANSNRYVQFLSYEDGSLIIEVVSNQYLTGDDQLSAEGELFLTDQGWTAPPAGEKRNWQFVDATATPPTVQAAARAMAVVRSVFGLDDDGRVSVQLLVSPVRTGTPLNPHPVESPVSRVTVRDETNGADGTAIRWSRANLFEYWDEREGAIAQFAAALREADKDAAQAQVTWLAKRVGDMARATTMQLLSQTAWVMADDLYKAASSTSLWDNALAQYLTATARELTSALSERELTLAYVVDNTFTPENMQRPLTLFGPWFSSAGFVYICPQAIAVELAGVDGYSTEEPDWISRYISESRHVAKQLVSTCLQDHHHYMYLDVDFQTGALDLLVNQAEALPGVISVWRSEAPLPGTNVHVHSPTPLLP